MCDYNAEYDELISRLEPGERESCGCQWYRGAIEIAGVTINGDHLLQCDGHKAGTAPPLPGSEPPDDEELDRLLGVLHGAGFETVVLNDSAGIAGRRPFND